MKVKFEHIPSIVRRYGMLAGMNLYFKLKLGKIINLPGVKSPIHLRKNTSDIHTFFQIFINKEYGNVKSKDAKFIIDGGANIGLFASSSNDNWSMKALARMI